MKRSVVRRLLLLYPAVWRNEYGSELEDLLLAEPLRFTAILNVVSNALRQQVRTSTHPGGLIRLLASMAAGVGVILALLQGQRSVFRLFLAVGVFFFGLRALGYWAILRIGSPRPADSAGIALVAFSSALLFIILSYASAWLRERTRGARAIAVKTLFLMGAHGLPAIALFAIVSKGAVLQIREVIGLLILFLCFVLVFRRPIPRHKLNPGVSA